MKITVIYGQNHKGSTYHVARMLAEKVGGEIKEIFLPRDFSEYCVGCTKCFMEDAKLCPYNEKLQPITDAILEADLLIFASPVYVYHCTAPMKNLLDHYGYMWMVHRPEERMFKKQAVCISTAAGAGMKTTNKDMADSLFFWGVPKVYKYGTAVQATSFDGITAKKRAEIEKKTDDLAKKIIRNNGKVKPGLKTIGFFNIMRMMMKNAWNPADGKYWQEKGWLQNKRPWK